MAFVVQQMHFDGRSESTQEIARKSPKTTRDKMRTTHHTTRAHARTAAEEKRAANDAKKKRNPAQGHPATCRNYYFVY
jgi:hypothetical protein